MSNGERTPYRFLVHTHGALGAPLGAPAPEHPVMTYTTLSVREQAPGLRSLFLTAVMLSPRTTSPARFSHLRSIEPGHRIVLRTIRGKCWIASRARLTGPSRAQGPEMDDIQGPGGPGGPGSGPFWPVSGPSGTRIRASRTPDPVVLAIPGWPGSQEAGILAAFDKRVG